MTAPSDARNASAAGRPTSAPAPSVSVAVCTRNRTAALRRALLSLIPQTTAPAEILVIDNDPANEATLQLVRNEFPSVRYIRESVAGLDFARNRALAEATTDVVAFLDDDAVAEPDWVEATRRVFSAWPALGACTGRVSALGTGTAGELLFEANGGFARGPRPIHLGPGAAAGPRRRMPLIAWSISIGSGCSMAVRRSLVLDLGGFDEALDLGEALPGGGDLDILWRMMEAGHEVRYDPTVRARHEHRADAQSAVWQICGHNRALVAWLTKCAARAHGRKRLEVLAFLLWRLAKPGVRLARRAIGRDPLPAPALLRLWSQTWRGLFAYAPARRLATRRRTAATATRDMPGAPC
jgi:GT2 family glycosyltransferase